MVHAMKTTIDAAGRIVVPKPVRRAACLEPGTELEVRLVGDHIELEPTPARVRLVRRGQITVAEALEPRGLVTQADVDAVVDGIRAERGR
jgi:AbrB family looped-hinge helix DNA binding protein